MKKIGVFIAFIALLCAVSCSGEAERYDCRALLDEPFCAYVSGELNGVPISAQVISDGGVSGDLYIRYLTGSLAEVAVRRSGGRLSFSRGGIEYAGEIGGELSLVGELFFPQELSFLRTEMKNGERVGVFSASVNGITYELTSGAGGVPVSIYVGEGNALSVDRFVRGK